MIFEGFRYLAIGPHIFIKLKLRKPIQHNKVDSIVLYTGVSSDRLTHESTDEDIQDLIPRFTHDQCIENAFRVMLQNVPMLQMVGPKYNPHKRSYCYECLYSDGSLKEIEFRTPAAKMMRKYLHKDFSVDFESMSKIQVRLEALEDKGLL